VLEAADVIVVALPLNDGTRGLIAGRELGLMKPEAILVNVARGPIVDEPALYAHLRDNPSFTAGLDTWWHEPSGSEEFHADHPFLELPNVLGSPHTPRSRRMCSRSARATPRRRWPIYLRAAD
jgi:phosphoglycerate dehydrogenase-like enzyme